MVYKDILNLVGQLEPRESHIELKAWVGCNLGRVFVYFLIILNQSELYLTKLI